MYSIYADGVCIYSDVFALESMKVLSPKLVLEDNGAGSLSMKLPPMNVGYESIIRMITDISVQKDGEEIWAGRVLSESKDFWNNRDLYCEGEMAFFNDSSQPPAEYRGLSVRAYLERLIAVHNSKVAANRQFSLGAVTVVDKNFPIYYTNYEKTMEILNTLVEQYGGHLRVRKVNGVRYLDYLAEYPDTCSQVIQFGSNLIDFTRKWDSTEFATVIVPLGNRLEDSPIEALDAYLTVESVNRGSMYVQSNEAVAAYGWIEKTVTWDDVSDPAVLLEKAKTYLTDIQFDNLELELSALDLHYLDVKTEAVKLLDEIRVISRPHGLDRMFPVKKLDIPLDNPEQTQFTLGDVVKTSLTSVNNQTSAAILQKIEALPKAHSILKEAKENATQIMNMATTGYITITKDQYGSETLYISNVRDYTKADKLWKWNMNGLGYSNDGGKTFGLAITMDGSIVADYITTGVLNADVIRAGVLKDYGGNFSLDFETGKLTMKKGSINIGNGNFTVDEDGNLFARRGTFAGTLSGAKGTFGGQLVAASGDFKGVVQASDFLDRYGRSMMSGDKFASDYLDLYGLTIRNKNTGAITFAVSSTGVITINGNVTMGAGSSINWAQVTNQNLAYNPAYSLADSARTTANQAYSLADDAYYEAQAAYNRANQAYKMANSIEMPWYIKSTYIDATTIKSPVIEGGEFYGGEFNVIAGSSYGSFNLYGPYGNSRYHMLTISYYEGDAPYIDIYSPCGGYITIGRRSGVVYFSGRVDFSGATVTGLD
ncbi:phage tail protein [uncultured Oscillibacter sp.]|uniref:phage tail protein n=1 Tax=uncultured Oscillibacter sp. TaxID=876091 RepID=UPI00272D5D12|nr:phage tail protein [uncultured Oscillibacter sp.]